jgi:hypothetical protein
MSKVLKYLGFGIRFNNIDILDLGRIEKGGIPPKQPALLLTRSPKRSRRNLRHPNKIKKYQVTPKLSFPNIKQIHSFSIEKPWSTQTS